MRFSQATKQADVTCSEEGDEVVMNGHFPDWGHLCEEGRRSEHSTLNADLHNNA